jgi:hypothetical protein
LGITPGLSTYQEAKNTLIPLSSLSTTPEFNPRFSWISFSYFEGDLLFHFSLFFVTANIVKNIHFQAYALREYEGGEESIYDSTDFGEQLAFYRLPNVLSQYGKPDSVLIKTYSLLPGRATWSFFYIVLLYPNQGIFIKYETIVRPVGDNFLGCPNNTFVELNLSSSGDVDAFYEHLPQNLDELADSFKPIDKVTSFTIDKFYETFRVPTDKCILTSSKIWPSGDYEQKAGYPSALKMGKNVTC